MDNFNEFDDNPVYDIQKLSAERNRRLNRYRSRQTDEPQELTLEINFTLTNTFWGNSWTCDEKIKIRKGKGLRTNINVNSSHTLSEVWDCRVIYYNSVEDHNIYLRSLDKDITIQICNNILSSTCDETYSLSGQISENVKV